MAESKKLVPKRRFKEFQNAEAWEQRKLGEFGYFYYGKSAPKWSVTEGAETPCVRYGELYSRYNEKIDKILSYTNVPKDNLKFSTGKEVLVPRVGEDPLDFANCTWLSVPNVAIGEMISVYNTDQNPLFTAYMFNGKLKHEFAKRVEGGNVSNLYYKYLEDILISYPSMEEQKKIADLFENLENLITLHQRKLEKIKSTKKAYLYEMFPAEGESRPKRRFKGFTGDWELCKLSQIATLTSSKRVHAEEYVESGIPFYRGKEITELRDNKVISELLYIASEKYEEIKSLYGSPEVGDVLITAVGTIGNTWVVDKIPFYFKDGNLIWFKNIKCDPTYLDYVLNSPNGRLKVMNSAIGSNQKALTMVKLNEIEITIPNVDEQNRIGAYFNNLDNLITLHQHKLDKLKNLKKSYLNEMFI